FPTKPPQTAGAFSIPAAQSHQPSQFPNKFKLMTARRSTVRNHPSLRNQRPQRRRRLPPHLWCIQGASQVLDQFPVPRRQARVQPQGTGLGCLPFGVLS
ncbi:hypothetical protein GC1_09385, partial [Leisingera sp. ANG1]